MSYIVNLSKAGSVVFHSEGWNPPTPPPPVIPTEGVISFYHISDIHNYYGKEDSSGNKIKDSLSECKERMESASNDVAFTIFTGDYSWEQKQFTEATPLYNALKNFKYNSNNEKKYDFLMLNGNHDAWDAFRVTPWPGKSTSERATAYLKEVMEDTVIWGDENGDWSYWYKDYTVSEESGAKLRIIGIDSHQYFDESSRPVTNYYYYTYDVIYRQNQINWVISLIKDLKPIDYLIIAMHEPPTTGQRESEGQKTIKQILDGVPGSTKYTGRENNSFLSYNLKGWGTRPGNGDIWPKLIYAYKNKQFIEEYIKNTNSYGQTPPTVETGVTLRADFRDIEAPCTFIGYLCGHVHGEFCIPHPIEKYSDQLIMCMDCTLTGVTASYSDIPNENRVTTTPSGDTIPCGVLINKVTIDFNNGTTKIERIGNNKVASYGNKYGGGTRKSITFDFNANIIENEPL